MATLQQVDNLNLYMLRNRNETLPVFFVYVYCIKLLTRDLDSFVLVIQTYEAMDFTTDKRVLNCSSDVTVLLYRSFQSVILYFSEMNILISNITPPRPTRRL